MAKNESVVFLDSAGNTISNDPAFLAKKLLSEAGVDEPQVDLDEIRASVRAEIEAEMAAAAAEENGQKDPSDKDDEYSSLDGKALKELAKERGIEIPSDVTKVGQLRDLLRSHDK